MLRRRRRAQELTEDEFDVWFRKMAEEALRNGTLSGVALDCFPDNHLAAVWPTQTHMVRVVRACPHCVLLRNLTWLTYLCTWPPNRTKLLLESYDEMLQQGLQMVVRFTMPQATTTDEALLEVLARGWDYTVNTRHVVPRLSWLCEAHE